jgi:branched-chain amino acid transport system ATP-binding protein
VTDGYPADGSGSARDGEALLVCEDLVSGYLPEVDILRGCHFELREGELVGIVGPNGAGKSTLVKTVFGLVPVRRGQVRFRDEHVTDLPAHELVSRGIGYVPQVANVFPALTVMENLEMGAYLDQRRVPERFEEVASLFPLLAERPGQRAGLLSGGERQMVAMGRALMLDPEVLLLDEPSSGLSPGNQGDVFDRIQQINDAGVSIVIVEQNARRCLQLADRGYVLDDGQNAYEGPGDELLADPKVIDLYLGTLTRAE